nr:MAG TPA: hypothetical protein [Caudoviricetes sp.]
MLKNLEFIEIGSKFPLICCLLPFDLLFYYFDF